MAKLPDIFAEEKPFNMAVLFLDRLNNRLDEAQLAAVEADLLKWYRVLRSIYRQVHFKVIEDGHEEEEKKLDADFREIKHYLQSTLDTPTNAANAHDFMKFTLSDAEVKLDRLEARLCDLLYKYKLIFPDLHEKKKDENIIKFLDKYVKKKVIKKALKDPSVIGIKENADVLNKESS